MDGTVLTNALAADWNSTEFYPTPHEVTRALIEFMELQGVTVWEPACGEGHMAEAMKALGVEVIATNLHDQGYGQTGVDYLTAPLPDCDWIITNPPFSRAEDFIRRSIQHGKPFALLLKSQYWHGKKRLDLFNDHKPVAVLPLTWRPDFHMGKKGGSPTMEVLWTIWGPTPAAVTEYIPLPKPCS